MEGGGGGGGGCRFLGVEGKEPLFGRSKVSFGASGSMLGSTSFTTAKGVLSRYSSQPITPLVLPGLRFGSLSSTPCGDGKIFVHAKA